MESSRYKEKIYRKNKDEEHPFRYAVKDTKTGNWVVSGIAKTKQEALTKAEESVGVYSKSKYWIHKDKSWDIKPCKRHPFDIKSKLRRARL